MFFDVLLWVIGFLWFFFNTIQETKNEFTINNIIVLTLPLPKATNSHVTSFSLPTSLSHIVAILPLLVSMVISSSFSSRAWEVVPNHSMIKRGEMRSMSRATRQTRTFSSRNDTRQHGVFFLRATCHLQPFGLVKRMEEHQDSKEVRALEML